ncbi:MAG: tRNA-modifying protein YgfZ [Enterobacterales bacterium]
MNYNKYPFLYKIPIPSKYLSPTLISMEDWILIKISGIDAKKYLQNQFTCDLFNLNKKKISFAAHCNQYGKTISTMIVFIYENCIYYITRRNIIHKQLTEFKKYSIFYKINICEDKNSILVGLAGNNIQNILKKIFINIPTEQNSILKNSSDLTLIYIKLPKPRFLLIIKKKNFDNIFNIIHNYVLLNNSMQWLSLDIESIYPLIDIKNSLKFIPQSLNMEYIDGINFHKGCYIGQEIISKIKYKNSNKFFLYWISYKSNILPKIGSNIEIKLKNNWKNTGTILAACKMINNFIWIQIVLNKKLLIDNQNIRILEQNEYKSLNIHNFKLKY